MGKNKIRTTNAQHMHWRWFTDYPLFDIACRGIDLEGGLFDKNRELGLRGEYRFWVIFKMMHRAVNLN